MPKTTTVNLTAKEVDYLKGRLDLSRELLARAPYNYTASDKFYQESLAERKILKGILAKLES